MLKGISESYADIREDKSKSFWKTKLKILIKKHLLSRDTIIEEELIRGYEYHQNEAKKDSHLMEWIKRENYINNGSIK